MTVRHIFETCDDHPYTLNVTQNGGERFDIFVSHFVLIVLIFSAPQTKEQFSALVSSFKMAWKIIRSCLTQDGKYIFYSGKGTR